MCAVTLFRAGAKIGHITDEGHTPLTLAAKHRNLGFAQALIQAGTNIEHITDEGHTALTLAVMYRNYVSVQALLQAGAKVEYMDLYRIFPKGWFYSGILHL